MKNFTFRKNKAKFHWIWRCQNALQNINISQHGKTSWNGLGLQHKTLKIFYSFQCWKNFSRFRFPKKSNERSLSHHLFALITTRSCKSLIKFTIIQLQLSLTRQPPKKRERSESSTSRKSATLRLISGKNKNFHFKTLWGNFLTSRWWCWRRREPPGKTKWKLNTMSQHFLLPPPHHLLGIHC